LEWHIPTLHRLPGVTEVGMTCSNITQVTRGYRRWNDIFQQYKGYLGLQKMEWHIPTLQRLPGVTEDGMTYSNITKVTRGYRRWNGIFQHYKGYPGLLKMEYSNITKNRR
jgi:hypothetical protein